AWILCRIQRVPQHLDSLPRTLHRAKHVEAHDITGAFPDRVDRRLAVEARHDAFLDVAGAAEHLHRLVGQEWRTLADPEFSSRGNYSSDNLSRFAFLVISPSEPHCEHCRRL